MTPDTVPSQVVRQTSPPRPSAVALLLVPAAVALDLLGRDIHSRLLTLAAAALLGAVVAALSLTPWIQGLRVSWLVPDRMTLGTESVATLIVTTPDRRAWRGAPLVLHVEHPGLHPTSVAVPSLDRGVTAEVQLPLRARSRGSWPVTGAVVVEVRSPLGGFGHSRRLALQVPLIVHPAPAAPLPQRTGDSGGDDEVARLISRRDLSGGEIAGLRDWRPGDPVAGVHWRATARRDRLTVIEREPTVHAQFTVVVGVVGEGPAWETAVARVAASAVQVVTGGGRVAVVTAEGSARPARVVDVLDCFAAINLAAPATAAGAAEVLGGRRADATLIWLSCVPPPHDLEAVMGRTGRAVGA